MSDNLRLSIVGAIYLVSAVLFILGLKRLTRVRTARAGNAMAAMSMLLAVVGTLIEIGSVDYRWIVGGLALGGAIGAFIAIRVPMTSMPEMVALLNGTGGAASALVALSVLWGAFIEPGAETTTAKLLTGPSAVTIGLSVFIGGITTTGSLIAWAKLQGKLKKGAPILLPGRHALNLLLVLGAIAAIVVFTAVVKGATPVAVVILVVLAIALVLGVTLTIPIGGADMPVVVSLLNSYSGIAAAMAGFVIGNNLLIIGGAAVGAAGIILTQLMCVAMNRSLVNVLVGGFGADAGSGGGGSSEYVGVTSSGAAEAAMILDVADSVMIVPGYGLAVAQAQHTVRELTKQLEARGKKVSYAIHPVAGRMPGHMNVLLAEADVPYEQLVELEHANPEMGNTDVAIVVGANDVVNPAALDDPTSPIYGMPIISVHEARTVFVIKRSLSPGYAGIKNPLFEAERTMMVFGDAKAILQEMSSELGEL